MSNNLIPKVYIYVEGGVIQGISSTKLVDITIFDKDNYDADKEKTEKETGYTLEEWNEFIDKGHETNHLIPIY